MSYEVKISEKALKSLKQIDKYQARIILMWINRNLAGCANPHLHGKAIVGDKKGYWRYRIGMYRVIAKIDDGHLSIEIINFAHQRDVYS